MTLRPGTHRRGAHRALPRRPGGAGIASLFATGLGLGRLPLAPGTWGSLGAMAVLGPLRFISPVSHAGVLAAIAAAGVWAAGRTARAMGRRDPGEVVVDEILGMGLTLAAVSAPRVGSLAAAFALFRVFDVLKPPPLRSLEKLPGGWGIMADDVGAALWASFVLWATGI